MLSLSLMLYPELRCMPDEARAAALRRARREPLDVLELLGIAAGLIVATMVMHYLLPEGAVSLPLRLVCLAGVCAMTIGPFLRRRTRRALAMGA
jgi:hypothetical protein